MNRTTLKHFPFLFLLFLAGAVFSFSSCEKDGLNWPEITSQNKPWTRWWWPASAVEKSDIDYMLEEYSNAGLGGVEVTTIYGAKGYEDKYVDYLSKEWMDLFTYTLTKADSIGLGVDLANASGWPFGGPWVKTEDACRYLATKTYTVKGGESIEDKIEYIQEPIVRSIGKRDVDISSLKFPIYANDSLQQYAFEQVRYPVSLPLIAIAAYGKNGEYEDLTPKVDENGNLNWTAPEGKDDWTICAMFLGWHGKLVERAGPGGEGDVIDHFNATATKNYLNKFDKAFEGYDVGKIRYYFNDSYEVDDARGNSDWTKDFFQEFEKRRGYDLKPYMLYLLGAEPDKEISDRIVFDYRTTIGELLLEKYSLTWQKWAASQGKGIRNQAHGSPANILDLYAVSDVPETEGRSIIGMKTASSAAHVTDKPLTSSESATWLNEHFRSDLGDVKKAMDTYLLAGVNHTFYHGTCMSPKDAPWPGWLFYAAVHFQPTNSFWADFPALNTYIARTQSFLQAGKPDNDILLFFDATDLLSERGREPLLYHMTQNTPNQSAIGEEATYLYDKGYTWDYITDKMILENIDVRENLIFTKEGTSYKTIIIPECKKMLPETFAKLFELAKKGAVVMVLNALPEDVPGFGELEKKRASLKGIKESLSFTEEENGVKIAHCGKGAFYLSDSADKMLSLAGISREEMYDFGLQCISRVKDKGGKYYFIKNSSEETVSRFIPIDSDLKCVGIYNPMTGKKGYGKVRKNPENGKNEVFLRLLPSETIILETFNKTNKGEEYVFLSPFGEKRNLDLTWNIVFSDGGPTIPKEQDNVKSGSWSSFGEDYAAFSGTATYTTNLPSQNGAATKAWLLDLGEVHETAAVYIDDEYMGTLLGEPFVLEIPSEKLKEDTTLKIRISNSMENRISYMDREGIEWRIFYNANIQARTPDSRGKDGLFSAASWKIKPSGLIGPISITPLAIAQ